MVRIASRHGEIIVLSPFRDLLFFTLGGTLLRKWKINDPDEPDTAHWERKWSLAVLHSRVFVATTKTLHCRRRDGTALSTFSLPEPSIGFAADEAALYTTHESCLLCARSHTGNLLYHVKLEQPHQIVVAGAELYVANGLCACATPRLTGSFCGASLCVVILGVLRSQMKDSWEHLQSTLVAHKHASRSTTQVAGLDAQTNVTAGLTSVSWKTPAKNASFFVTHCICTA